MTKLFKRIIELFKTDRGNTYTYYQLYNKMREWKTAGIYPSKLSLPDAITFPEEFWIRVIRLFKVTRDDGFERSISVFWVDGELILTSVKKGTKSSVSSGASIKVAYEPILKNGKYDYFWRKVWVNEKIYSKKSVYYKRVPKQLEKPIYLFNMHTHPPHGLGSGYSEVEKPDVGGDYKGRNAYSYWSAQDIRSFLSSGAVITGVITDKLHMLMRSSSSPSSADNFQDIQVSREFLNNEMSFGVYEGDFKKKLSIVKS